MTEYSIIKHQKQEWIMDCWVARGIADVNITYE
jgi:hypothetical protein